MYLYRQKVMDLGFIVLGINSVEQTKRTIDCILNYFGTAKILAVIHKDQEFKRATHTIKMPIIDKVAFLNSGISEPPCSTWNLFLMGGTIIKYSTILKLSCFVDSQKDIFFPVIDRKMYFTQSGLNGMLIHKSMLKEVGLFKEKLGFDGAILDWAGRAIEKQCKFKGIIGARLIFK